jgi:hypothetical protein
MPCIFNFRHAFCNLRDLLKVMILQCMSFVYWTSELKDDSWTYYYLI